MDGTGRDNPPRPAAVSRKDRLSDALKANIARRKAQAAARGGRSDRASASNGQGAKKPD